MKKFKLFKMLAVLIVLITSINQMWAYDYYWKGNIYFLAPDDWNLETNSHVQLGLVQGNTTNTAHYVSTWGDMDRIGSTRLYFIKGDATHTGYANQEYVAFIANNTTWSSNSFRLDGCAGYTTPSDYRFTSYDHPYLYVPNSDSNGATLSGSYCSDGSQYGDKIRNLLNKTQTIYIYTNGSASDAGGTVNLTGTEKGYGTTDCNSVDATSTSNTLSQNTCIGSINTLTATAESGYYFAGWFNSGTAGGSVESSPYTCKGAKTIYACFENRYTVTVSAGDHGSITEGGPSVSAGYYTHPTITAAPSGVNSEQYRFLKWTCTGGASVADENSATTTVSATSAGTVTAHFVSVWTIIGGDNATEDVPDDGDALGNWNVYNSLDYTGTAYEYSCTIDLPAKTAYRFKIYDYNSKVWYGCGTRNHDYTFVGQTDNVKINSTGNDGYNVMFMTGAGGTYTFEWNSNDKELKITYPSTVHPSMNYVYMEKYSGWNSGSHCYIHYWYTSGSDVPLTTWATDDPKITVAAYFSDKSKYFYMFPALTTYPKFYAKNNLGDPTGGNGTGNQEATGHEGHYVYHNGSAWVWGTFDVTINFNRQATVTSDGTTSQTVAFNDAVLSDITCPTWTGYTFGGYYNSSTCDDLQIVDGDGKWIASKTGYTDASKHWIKDGSVNTLYAKWTQIMVSDIDLDHTSASIYKGETLTITPTVTPATALDKAVTWESSTPGVATVNSSGVVTAVAPGTTTITATAHDGSGVTATCTITVGYKLTYNANGASTGSEPTDATYYANNGSATVEGSGTLDKTGYTFRCWNTQANGLGTDYAPESTYTMTDNTTLYAKWTNNDYIGKYTFHYGTSTTGNTDDFSGTWSIVAFPSTPTRSVSNDYYTNYDYEVSFTIPDPEEAPHFFVGWEGWPKPQLGTMHAGTASTVRSWSDEYNAQHYGRINVEPGSIVISDGESKTAEGAVGKLIIRDYSDVGSENLEVGFKPSGYVVTIKDSDGNTRTLSFTASDNSDIWETEILEDGLTAKEVHEEARFKVGLATSSSVVDCYQSAWVDKDALDANKDEYDPSSYEGKLLYPAVTAGEKGRFQLVLTSQTHNGGYNYNKTNFALRYVPLVNWTISYGTSWSGGSGLRKSIWSLGHQPTIDENVILTERVTVTSNDAVAKRIRINKEAYNTLTINPTGGLLVAEDIKAIHDGAEVVDGDGYSPTTSNDILIKTDYSDNGSLICGGASTNTEANYLFFSKSFKYNSYFVNQYIGIPFKECDAFDYYGMNIYEYDANEDSWKKPESSTLQSFTCYNMINKNNGGYESYYVEGILNLPGTSGTKVLECGSRYSTSGAFDDKDHNGDYMFANSWTAPISIKNINSDDYTGLNGEVHIFNAGYVNPSEDAKKEIGNYAGQWTGFSFNASSYIANAVIPATQAFCVTATAADATLTLKYGKHVYTPASAGINTFPTRAPRREKVSTDPKILRVNVRSDSTIADNIYLFERADFTNEYDNGWDCMKWFGKASVPQLYAIQGEGKVSISAIPDMEGTLLGFKAGTDASEYTFSFEYNDEEPLYLYDKDTKEVTQIDNEATYSFTTNDTAEHDRFMITRSNAPQVVTGYEEIEGEKVKRAEKFIENNTLFIRRGGNVYSIDGALVK